MDRLSSKSGGLLGRTGWIMIRGSICGEDLNWFMVRFGDSLLLDSSMF